MYQLNQERVHKIHSLIYDPEELKKCEKDPLYFHNKYVKDPDIPDRTQEQFEKWRKEVVEFRMMAGKDNRRYKAMSMSKYPVNIKECIK